MNGIAARTPQDDTGLNFQYRFPKLVEYLDLYTSRTIRGPFSLRGFVRELRENESPLNIVGAVHVAELNPFF